VARFAILLARQQPSEQIRSQTSIQLAAMLMSTRYWEYGSSLLASTQKHERCDVVDRKLTSYCDAARAFRLHRFHDVWTLANVEDDPGEPVALRVRRQLIAASAAYELEWRRAAHTLIETAIPAAERLGSAPLLRDAYSVGAKVTGDARFAREGREIERLLTA
jgi:hypothetical protein